MQTQETAERSAAPDYTENCYSYCQRQAYRCPYHRPSRPCLRRFRQCRRPSRPYRLQSRRRYHLPCHRRYLHRRRVRHLLRLERPRRPPSRPPLPPPVPPPVPPPPPCPPPTPPGAPPPPCCGSAKNATAADA